MWLMKMQRRVHIEVVCVVLWCPMTVGLEDETLPGVKKRLVAATLG